MTDNGSQQTAIVRVQRFNPDMDKKPYLQEDRKSTRLNSSH